MEKTEPTFIPEWLKNSGGQSTTSHKPTSSSLQSGEQGVSKPVRNKSLDKDLGRSSGLDRTNSSYFRRGSDRLRSYSSFNRNRRDRDWDKDIFEFRNKEKPVNKRQDYSDPLGNIFPSRFEKNGLRRSHSSISGKQGESWPKKVGSDLTVVKKSSQKNGDSLLSGNVKTTFEKDFPSLGADEKQVENDSGQVLSSGLSSVIQSLPKGNSAVIGDGWTSALAEVPVIVDSSGNGSSVAPPVQPAPAPATTGVTCGRNMAETLAQGPPRTQTPPQLTVGTQRLEELAVKQSRQLIPVTPAMPKALALNSSDRHKMKVGQSQFQSSHLINNPNASRSVTVKPDVSKAPSAGNFLILKPSREKNGKTPTENNSASPTGGGTKLPNSSVAVPSAVGSAPLKNSANGPNVANLEKRPSLQAQSRSNFFNLMRKKSMSSGNSSSVAPDTVSSGETTENHSEPPVAPEGGSGSTEVQQSCETKGDLTCNGDTCGALVRSLVNGKNHSGPVAILCSEEEEARFLRSLGWEETDEDEEGLTEEEISSFYQNYLNLKPASKILKGTVQKQLMPIGEISSNSKPDS